MERADKIVTKHQINNFLLKHHLLVVQAPPIQSTDKYNLVCRTDADSGVFNHAYTLPPADLP